MHQHNSRSTSPNNEENHEIDAQAVQDFIEELMQSEQESIASELGVLQSIYGDHSIRIRQESRLDLKHTRTIRYEVTLTLPSPHEHVEFRVLVSLPSSYPATSPPQLQLLSKYIGPFGVDSALFGSILRTFISVNGVEWTEDTVCVFDGLQNVLERCVPWYEDRLSAEKAGELVREDAKEHDTAMHSSPPEDETHVVPREIPQGPPTAVPEGVQIIESEAIIDRKSAFVGRACRISHPSQVPLILSHLMSDRRISRAAHPIINAWRCQVGPLVHQDNDDDGETAAGGRLAHLLQILEVNNVLVVVTRYFGGIHLGPDRFKHINQAARNALETGGFLDDPDAKKNVGRAKKR